VKVTRVRLSVIVVVCGACRITAPPPLVPFHAVTAPDERGATSMMIVAGTASQLLFGGDGWGLALRIEHQETTSTAVGVELTGGRGDQSRYADGTIFRHWLVGMRGYGRYGVAADGPFALQYGAGVSLAASGLVTATLDGGAAASTNNAHANPLTSLSAALAIPLRAGRAFSDERLAIGFGPPDPAAPSTDRRPRFRTPKAEIYLIAGLGVVVPLGDTDNRLSLDVSVGKALREGAGVIALTAADRQRIAK
jgi:hypothetical protein